MRKTSKAGVGVFVAGAVAMAATVIAPWEGKRNDPYVDIVGVETVCYGETRVDMRFYSDAECLAMLQDAVKGFTAAVLQCSPTLADRPVQLAAASSLAYNIGTGAYCRSTVDRRFDRGDYAGACDAFMMWVKAGGRTVRGLVNRRTAERELCLTGLNRA
ncbi:lysozyme [Pacificimonas sp. ICDLI1SI03]